MTAWRWIGRDIVLAIHDMQLAHHGGLDGVANDHLIDSALARPQQMLSYCNPSPDAFDLAAAYGFGFTRNHGFNDGNTRTDWILARLFLADNGAKIQYAPEDAIQLMQSVAAGTVTEQQFSEWLRSRQVSNLP